MLFLSLQQKEDYDSIQNWHIHLGSEFHPFPQIKVLSWWLSILTHELNYSSLLDHFQGGKHVPNTMHNK